MARKGLPKKYAKMGFAKGWKEYKKSKKRNRSKSLSTKTTKKNTMAKKKKTYRRRGSSKKFTDLLIGGIGAAAVSSMIPGGALGKLAVGYFGHKKSGVIGALATGLCILGAANLLSGNGLGGLTSGLGNIGGGVTSD